MASFYKRGARWEVRIRRKGYAPQHATLPRLRDAKIWARKVEQEMDAGRWLDQAEAESTTLYDALTRYARDVTPGKKGSARELRRIGWWKQHVLAYKTLAAIRGRDLAAYRAWREDKGAASNTIRLELALIGHLYTVARRRWGMEGLINPVQNIEMPRGSSARERRLLDGEETALLEACERRDWHDGARAGWLAPIVRFAIETGMRQGEILGLRWSDIVLKRRIARLGDTKSGDPRTVPLSTRALAVLRAVPHAADGRVFPAGSDNVQRAFRRAVERARERFVAQSKGAHRKPDARFLTDLRFHDLRHEAVSRLFERGLDAMEVASISGHKTMQMLRRYTHLRAERLADKLG